MLAMQVRADCDPFEDFDAGDVHDGTAEERRKIVEAAPELLHSLERLCALGWPQDEQEINHFWRAFDRAYCIVERNAQGLRVASPALDASAALLEGRSGGSAEEELLAFLRAGGLERLHAPALGSCLCRLQSKANHACVKLLPNRSMLTCVPSSASTVLF
jgi:hypothetical protein